MSPPLTHPAQRATCTASCTAIFIATPNKIIRANLPWVFTAALMTACTPVPNLTADSPPDTAYLDIISTQQIVTQALSPESTQSLTQNEIDDLAARAARLRARAEDMRGANVVDQTTSDRMDDASR